MRIVQLTTDSREHYGDYQNPQPYFGAAPAALLQGFAAQPEVEVHVISCLQQPVASPEKIAPNIFYHGLHVPKLGWMRTLYSGCSRAVQKKIHEISPDIVHGQGTERDCALSAVRSGFPNVLTIHGNMRLIAKVNVAKPFSFLWLAAQLERFTLPRTDGMVCITHYTRAAVEKLVPRTWVLPNAVDETFFLVNPAPDSAAPPVGICVGTICLRKNQNNFIRALDALAARKKFQMVFLGETAGDEYGREFLRLVKERPWCQHAGFAGREELKKQFARASFLVLPTLEDNCPMTVLEAMAAGVPCAASAVGGVPDLIEPEVTGLFFDPHRPETFEAQVSRLIEDASLGRRISIAARATAEKRFHPTAVARRHLEIYRDVLGQKLR